jgi:hypothetical protein
VKGNKLVEWDEDKKEKSKVSFLNQRFLSSRKIEKKVGMRNCNDTRIHKSRHLLPRNPSVLISAKKFSISVHVCS